MPHSSDSAWRKGQWPNFTRGARGGWITSWLMVEGRRPNDGPVSRWIFTGISTERLMDPDWVNVCLSLVSRNRRKNCWWPCLRKKDDKPATKSINYAKIDKYILFWLQFVPTMVLESHKNIPKHLLLLLSGTTVESPQCNQSNFIFNSITIWYVAGTANSSHRWKMEVKYI